LTQLPVAVKTIRRSCLEKQDTRKHFEHEVRVLRMINHPLIVRLLDVLADADWVYIVLEFSPCGDLFTYITQRMRLPESECRTIFAQIAAALLHLHQDLHIVHRDVKPENVLLDFDLNVRLIDFGFAKQYFDPDQTFHTLCGTAVYAAPEVASGAPYTASVDVWSLGVVLYVMSVGQMPFVDRTEDPPYFPSYLSDEIVDLMCGMLERDPAKRMSLTAIRDHEWMKEAPKCFAWPGIPQMHCDPSIVARVRGLGLQIAEGEILQHANTEGPVSYRILECERHKETYSVKVMNRPIARLPLIKAGPVVWTPLPSPKVARNCENWPRQICVPRRRLRAVDATTCRATWTNGHQS
jgi:serine/threonine protein kinase